MSRFFRDSLAWCLFGVASFCVILAAMLNRLSDFLVLICEKIAPETSQEIKEKQ